LFISLFPTVGSLLDAVYYKQLSKTHFLNIFETVHMHELVSCFVHLYNTAVALVHVFNVLYITTKECLRLVKRFVNICQSMWTHEYAFFSWGWRYL